MGCFSRRRGQRQIDRPLHGGHRERWLAWGGPIRLTTQQSPFDQIYESLAHGRAADFSALQRLQVRDDISDLAGIQPEFRH